MELTYEEVRHILLSGEDDTNVILKVDALIDKCMSKNMTPRESIVYIMAYITGTV